jgi:hypothetical protein
MKKETLQRKFGISENEINELNEVKTFEASLEEKSLVELRKIRMEQKPKSYFEFLVIKKELRKIRTFKEAVDINATIKFDHEAKPLILNEMLNFSSLREEVIFVWEKRDHSNYVFGNEVMKKLILESEDKKHLAEVEKIVNSKTSFVSSEVKEMLFEKIVSKTTSFEEAEVLYHSVHTPSEKKVCLEKLLEFSTNQKNLKRIFKLTEVASIRFEAFQKLSTILAEKAKTKKVTTVS